MFHKISNSMNPVLSFLLAEKTKEITSAIVDPDGNGNYITLQDAIAAGVKRIFLKNGTYIIDSDLEIDTHNIIGESIAGVILKFTNNATIVFNNSSSVINKGVSGSIEVGLNKGSDLVDGIIDPPEFDSIVQSSKTRFSIGSFFTKIDAIDDDYNMHFKNIMNGRDDDTSGTRLGLYPFNLGNYDSIGTVISNLTVNYFSEQSATLQNAFEVYGHNHKFSNINFLCITDDNVSFINTVPDFFNENICTGLIIEHCSFEGAKQAILLNQSKNTTIENSWFINQETDMIHLVDEVHDLKILYNTFSNTDSVITSGQTKENFTKIKIEYNKFLFINNNAMKISTWGNTIADNSNIRINGNYFEQCNTCIETDTSSLVFENNHSKRCTHVVKDYVIGLDSKFGGRYISNIFENCFDGLILHSPNPIIAGNIFKSMIATPVSHEDGNCIVKANQFFNCANIGAYGGSVKFSNNIVRNDNLTNYNLTGDDSSFSSNWWENSRVTIQSGIIFKGNQLQHIGIGFAITVQVDQVMISANKVVISQHGIDIQATADKTHLCENILQTITTTTVQNNGTNTVDSNTIVVA